MSVSIMITRLKEAINHSDTLFDTNQPMVLWIIIVMMLILSYVI